MSASISLLRSRRKAVENLDDSGEESDCSIKDVQKKESIEKDARAIAAINMLTVSMVNQLLEQQGLDPFGKTLGSPSLDDAQSWTTPMRATSRPSMTRSIKENTLSKKSRKSVRFTQDTRNECTSDRSCETDNVDLVHTRTVPLSSLKSEPKFTPIRRSKAIKACMLRSLENELDIESVDNFVCSSDSFDSPLPIRNLTGSNAAQEESLDDPPMSPIVEVRKDSDEILPGNQGVEAASSIVNQASSSLSREKSLSEGSTSATVSKSEQSDDKDKSEDQSDKNELPCETPVKPKWTHHFDPTSPEHMSPFLKTLLEERAERSQGKELSKSFSSTEDSEDQQKQSILKGVTAFVEVIRADEDRSSGFRWKLKQLGAQVEENFTKKVTHVVFQEGLLSTYRKAKESNVHLVSAFWVMACDESGSRAPEDKYPIDEEDKYSSLAPLKKYIRRPKLLSPSLGDGDDEKRLARRLQAIKRRSMKHEGAPGVDSDTSETNATHSSKTTPDSCKTPQNPKRAAGGKKSVGPAPGGSSALMTAWLTGKKKADSENDNEKTQGSTLASESVTSKVSSRSPRKRAAEDSPGKLETGSFGSPPKKSSSRSVNLQAKAKRTFEAVDSIDKYDLSSGLVLSPAKKKPSSRTVDSSAKMKLSFRYKDSPAKGKSSSKSTDSPSKTNPSSKPTHSRAKSTSSYGEFIGSPLKTKPSSRTIDSSAKTKLSSGTIDSPAKVSSRTVDSPAKTKSSSRSFDSPAKTESSSRSFDSPAKTKSSLRAFDSPTKTKSRSFDSPSKTKSSSRLFDTPSKTKSSSRSFDSPAKTKSSSRSFDSPAKTKSSLRAFDSPTKTKSRSFDSPSKTKSSSRLFDTPSKTKSSSRSVNTPSKTKSSSRSFDTPSKTNSSSKLSDPMNSTSVASPERSKSRYESFDVRKVGSGKDGRSSVQSSSLLERCSTASEVSTRVLRSTPKKSDSFPSTVSTSDEVKMPQLSSVSTSTADKYLPGLLSANKASPAKRSLNKAFTNFADTPLRCTTDDVPIPSISEDSSKPQVFEAPWKKARVDLPGKKVQTGEEKLSRTCPDTAASSRPLKTPKAASSRSKSERKKPSPRRNSAKGKLSDKNQTVMTSHFRPLNVIQSEGKVVTYEDSFKVPDGENVSAGSSETLMQTDSPQTCEERNADLSSQSLPSVVDTCHGVGTERQFSCPSADETTSGSPEESPMFSGEVLNNFAVNEELQMTIDGREVPSIRADSRTASDYCDESTEVSVVFHEKAATDVGEDSPTADVLKEPMEMDERGELTVTANAEEVFVKASDDNLDKLVTGYVLEASEKTAASDSQEKLMKGADFCDESLSADAVEEPVKTTLGSEEQAASADSQEETLKTLDVCEDRSVSEGTLGEPVKTALVSEEETAAADSEEESVKTEDVCEEKSFSEDAIGEDVKNTLVSEGQTALADTQEGSLKTMVVCEDTAVSEDTVEEPVKTTLVSEDQTVFADTQESFKAMDIGEDKSASQNDVELVKNTFVGEEKTASTDAQGETLKAAHVCVEKTVTGDLIEEPAKTVDGLSEEQTVTPDAQVDSTQAAGISGGTDTDAFGKPMNTSEVREPECTQEECIEATNSENNLDNGREESVHTLDVLEQTAAAGTFEEPVITPDASHNSRASDDSEQHANNAEICDERTACVLEEPLKTTNLCEEQTTSSNVFEEQPIATDVLPDKSSGYLSNFEQDGSCDSFSSQELTSNETCRKRSRKSIKPVNKPSHYRTRRSMRFVTSDITD